MKHKHYDCIVAWANGEEIEYFDRYSDKWESILGMPTWNHDTEYRIKKKPVIEVKYFICSYGEYKETLSKIAYDLKITYQDGIAIKAEVAE